MNIDVNPFTLLVKGCVQPSVLLFIYFYSGNKGHWLEDILSTCEQSDVSQIRGAQWVQQHPK